MNNTIISELETAANIIMVRLQNENCICLLFMLLLGAPECGI